MDNTRLRWGILGTAQVARKNWKAILDTGNAVVMAVASRDVERSRRFIRECQSEAPFENAPVAFGGYAELLASQDLDAVYVPLPTGLRKEWVVRAAEAGKHVLCEKPVAVSIRQVDRMAEACRQAGVKFMLGFCMRNHVYHKKARELVLSGALGQMVMGRAQLTCWYPPVPGAWRQNLAVSHGGALIDMGSHCLDILEWIMDTRIVEVTGFQDLRTHAYATRIEDTSTILARFGNGAHGIIDNYFNIPDAAAQNRLELYGTKGTLIGEGTIGQDPTGKMFSILQAEETAYDANQVRNAEAQRQEYQLEGIGLYGQMIDCFSRCILDNTEPPVTLADGRHSVAVILAIYEAIRKRKVVGVRD